MRGACATRIRIQRFVDVVVLLVGFISRSVSWTSRSRMLSGPLRHHSANCRRGEHFNPSEAAGIRTEFRTSVFMAVPGADIEQPPIDSDEKKSTLSKVDSASDLSSMARGKVNEIDFCIAPADVSLSRAYGVASASLQSPSSPASAPILSLTRALNNASNRAVRRILLARSWPSAEALNLSLRRAAAAEKERERLLAEGLTGTVEGMKCPVPRPILNVLTRKRDATRSGTDGSLASGGGNLRQPVPRSRTDEEYVADQLKAFRERYGELPGYAYAEAYLESILSLATAGVESTRVQEVLRSGVYDESYRRVIGVLRSVGVQFDEDSETGRSRINSKLIDQDICLSMLDKLQMNGGLESSSSVLKPLGSQSEAQEKVITDDLQANRGLKADESGLGEFKRQRKFWKREKPEEPEEEISREDLGGVLLSSEEPSMTRQLNVLSNIVQRALLFGGDEELLVLAETLEADRAAFADRWYPDTGGILESLPVEAESRPGVQFLNCLVKLLRDCYDDGVVTDLNPPLPLPQSYANSYERLVTALVELGSGYIRPGAGNFMTMPKPRSAREELGRFAVWESTFRQTNADTSPYPDDMQGVWEVRDEIGGELIGKSYVSFGAQGKLDVDPPLEGLRWRLDPGPTHLDTCTFQVLSSDGTILQYRGFIDRGARLESRFSRRPIKIRGSVMFQMRDGSIDYYKDMLPINYRTGTTKFVMTKKDDSTTRS